MHTYFVVVLADDEVHAVAGGVHRSRLDRAFEAETPVTEAGALRDCLVDGLEVHGRVGEALPQQHSGNHDRDDEECAGLARLHDWRSRRSTARYFAMTQPAYEHSDTTVMP
jgi:hypothetical protein